jgi:hypothetical protein
MKNNQCTLLVAYESDTENGVLITHDINQHYLEVYDLVNELNNKFLLDHENSSNQKVYINLCENAIEYYIEKYKNDQTDIDSLITLSAIVYFLFNINALPESSGFFISSNDGFVTTINLSK